MFSKATLLALLGATMAYATPISRGQEACPKDGTKVSVVGSALQGLKLFSYDDKYNTNGVCSYHASWKGQSVWVMTTALRPPYYPGTSARARTISEEAYDNLVEYGDFLAEDVEKNMRHWLVRKEHDDFVKLTETDAFKIYAGKPGCVEWAEKAYDAVGQAAYNAAAFHSLVNEAIELDTVLFYASDPLSTDNLPIFTQWEGSKTVQEISQNAHGVHIEPETFRQQAVGDLKKAVKVVDLCGVNNQ